MRIDKLYCGKKQPSESGDGYSYYKCPCGKTTKYNKKNPVYTEVSRWLDKFSCSSCGKKHKS
jgi:tRNA(Ile2) C34 agmatinyltransferase TiaS